MKDVEAVGKRPGMYIGSTEDISALQEMAFALVANAINESLAGYCSHIDVVFNPDGSATVRDDGRGLPVDLDPMKKASKAELIMTSSTAAGWFEQYPESTDLLDGASAFVVNALSAWLTLHIWRDGRVHFMRFREGHPEAPLQAVGSSNGKRGTEIEFLPDPGIFTVTRFHMEALEHRLRNLAGLNARVTIILEDRRGKSSKKAEINL
ncbi:MAG: ATP-binding protein [Dongiaceae bacterium]